MDVTFRVFTGNTGIGGTAPGMAGVWAVISLWFISPVNDTLVPDPATGQFDTAALAEHKITDWNATVGRGYSYNTERTYAEVIRMKPGWHRLWHGVELNTADTFHNDWYGGGWLEAIGVTPKVFPIYCDNRASMCPQSLSNPDPSFIRHPGCHSVGKSQSSEVDNVHLCDAGEQFWSVSL